MQLLGPDINIAGQDVVHDDILYKGATIVLFFVEDLGIVQRNIGNGAECLRVFIVSGAEYGIFEEIGAANNCLKALTAKGNHTLRAAKTQGGIRPMFSKQGNIRTGYNATLSVNNSERSVGNIF